MSFSLSGQQRPREYDIPFGDLPTGQYNAITDVPGVKVGQVTNIRGEKIRTGITAILPHEGQVFQQKVPAAIYLGNGFGKLMGYSQVAELGNIETPIVLTNTLSVPIAANGIIEYVLNQEGNENVRSVNPVVGETNDGRLNDIRSQPITKKQVITAIENASAGAVVEGNVGAGTGTVCFGWKGGIGTASRKIGAYTLGVLVQTNFGGNLKIGGLDFSDLYRSHQQAQSGKEDKDGSCMIIVATDAPISDRNLERLAKRAMLGLARAGGIASNGSGDYVIAFSNAETNRIPYQTDTAILQKQELRNARMTPFFQATIDATEEAIINSLFAAETMRGNDYRIEALPVEEVLERLRKHKLIPE
ncbi:MAG TPA: P1 family peptidase [Saprospiraceae bacterium]|nr:P1 family peptidase [Saprospiraceae bacterium]